MQSYTRMHTEEINIILAMKWVQFEIIGAENFALHATAIIKLNQKWKKKKTRKYC